MNLYFACSSNVQLKFVPWASVFMIDESGKYLNNVASHSRKFMQKMFAPVTISAVDAKITCQKLYEVYLRA